MDFFELAWPLTVVALIIFAAYWATKWISKRQNTYTSGKVIQVLERVMLGKDAYIAVIKVDTKLYLMSVSAGKTELLTELDSALLEKYKPAGTPVDFMSILKNVISGKQNGGDKKE